MFSNWTRKTGGFVLLVWAFMVMTITVTVCRRDTLPTLVELGGFVTSAILAACGVLAVLGGKSIGTDAVNKVKSTGGEVTSEPVKTENP